MKQEILNLFNERLSHHNLHNEYGKDIRIDEVKILKLIIKNYGG